MQPDGPGSAEPVRRIFLAVVPDRETVGLVHAHLEAHGVSSWPGKVVPPQNWHIISCFLGSITPTQQDLAVRYVDQEHLPSPFEALLGGLGGFPRASRARVAWIGVTNGTEELSRLAEVANGAAVAAGLRGEERPYVPHMTIARMRPPADIRDQIAAVPPLDLRMPVRTLTMFRSYLEPTGARYEIVETFPL